jgi:riboflavin kinase / FMN adenylyltransferase
MRIVRGLDRYPADAPPSAVAQGTFDGIHLGHQEVIRTAVERAGALGARAVAVTFDPNPVVVLRPAEAPPEILPLDERLERIGDLGPDVCLVIPFTLEFSRVEAEAFVRDVLLGLLHAREIVVGFNHTFGRGARGTPALLREVAAPAGTSVHVIQPLRVGDLVVSSSAVRDALRRGEVRLTQRLLGRPYTVRGPVARGDQRGRDLGFPTANLHAPPNWLLADGVYAGRADWAGQSAPAVVNVGTRPTFDGRTRLVEAHLLDAAPELYGQTLTVAFLDRIRGERRFPSVDALRAQIAADVVAARAVLSRGLTSGSA